MFKISLPVWISQNSHNAFFLPYFGRNSFKTWFVNFYFLQNIQIFSATVNDIKRNINIINAKYAKEKNNFSIPTFLLNTNSTRLLKIIFETFLNMKNHLWLKFRGKSDL